MLEAAPRTAAFLLAVGIAAAPAAAKERDPEAGRHADEASAFYKAGEYEKAVDAFRRAYAIDPDPRLLFNLARSTEKIGDIPRTVKAYEGFLESWPDAPNRKEVEAKIGAFREQAAKTHRELKIESTPTDAEVRVGDALDLAGRTPLSRWFAHGPGRIRVSRTGYLPEDRRLEIAPATPALQTFTLTAQSAPAHLLVTGVPDGAEILVDGSLMGVAPLSAALQVHPGPRTVGVRAKGFLTWQRHHEAKPGARETLSVTLVPEPPKPVETTPSAAAPAGADDGLMVPWTAWTAAGLSAAALAFGGVHIILALDDAEQAKAESAKEAHGDPVKWKSLKDRAEERLLLSNIGFGVGGAGVLATGLLLWMANAE